MFYDIFCNRYDNKDECLMNANIVKTFAGRFGIVMVIYWTRFWEKVVSFREQSTRSLGQHCGTDVAGNCRKRTSYLSFNDSNVQGSAEKQRARNVVYSLHCWSRYNWQFIALFFLTISSVSTEQWQQCARNLKTTKIERGNMWHWWESQLFLATSNKKFFCQNENPMNDQIIWQQYVQQVESLSPGNRVSKFCEGCDVVGCDRAPQAGVAQGVWRGPLVGRWVGHQEGLEEERWDEVENEGHKEEDRQLKTPITSAHAWMTWMTHTRQSWATSAMWGPLCINGRRAVCSELRVVRVRVRDGVLVIHRSVLKRDVVMREGVRNAVAIIVYRKCSWIWGAGFVPFTPPVGDNRLPSAVTDFTIKISNSSARWDSFRK